MKLMCTKTVKSGQNDSTAFYRVSWAQQEWFPNTEPRVTPEPYWVWPPQKTRKLINEKVLWLKNPNTVK